MGMGMGVNHGPGGWFRSQFDSFSNVRDNDKSSSSSDDDDDNNNDNNNNKNNNGKNNYDDDNNNKRNNNNHYDKNDGNKNSDNNSDTSNNNDSNSNGYMNRNNDEREYEHRYGYEFNSNIVPHSPHEEPCDLWVCLVCGFIGCGSSHCDHIRTHYLTHLHAYAMNTGTYSLSRSVLTCEDICISENHVYIIAINS